MRKYLLPPWPQFSPEEVAAATEVLQSGKTNYWGGEHGRAFEAEFADYIGVQKAIALANGSIALELALRALGIDAGTEVIVSPRSFMASAACVVNVGAKPVFADVDIHTQNISAASVSAVLSPASKAIICVHLGGYPCHMEELQRLAQQHNLYLIEDCAQAHGAAINGRKVGSFGHLAAWSFCQDKIISCAGEGGMITTNDAELARRVWQLKDHGKDPDLVHQPHQGYGFRWLHQDFGSNARLTEVQAAIGRIQLSRLPTTIQLRTRNAELLSATCARHPAVRQVQLAPGAQPAWYRFYGFVDPSAWRPGHDRVSLLQAINAAGYPAFEGSCPEIYREQAFAAYGQPRLPGAASLGEQSLAFLAHANISLAQMQAYCRVVDQALQAHLLVRF